MGQLTFIVPPDLPASARQDLQHACIVGGYDLTPIPTQVRFEGNSLIVERDTHESVHFLAPWPIPGFGCPVVLSATLREREKPYDLVVELARGKLNQLRMQAADWEWTGLELSEADRQELRQLTRLFGQAVFSETPAEAQKLAIDTLQRCHVLSDRITRLFARLLMMSRVEQSGKPDTHFGSRLTRVPDTEATLAYRTAFNAVRLVPNWQAIEPMEARCVWDELDALVDWATEAGLAISVGPLIDLSAGTAPVWLSQWDGDLPSLAAFMSDFVETIIARYQDRVSSWQVFSGLNHTDKLGLSEDDRLRLAARLIESARQTAPSADLGIGIALPWGDYLTTDQYTYSPLVFADTLQRAGYNIAGIELELLFGNDPRASQIHTVMDCYRLLDLFAVLGIPLEMQIGCPATPASGSELPPGIPEPGWVSGTVFLGMSVPQVRAIYWSNWDETSGSTEALRPNGQSTGARYAELNTLGKKWLAD